MTGHGLDAEEGAGEVDVENAVPDPPFDHLDRHRRVAEQKRAAIIEAATRLFLDAGYAGTSLAKVAEAAEVSKATLFKQFPTKAALFDAIVTESWKVEDEGDLRPPTGDLRAGLTAIGHRYVALLTRPGMAPSSASSSPSCRASPSWARPTSSAARCPISTRYAAISTPRTP